MLPYLFSLNGEDVGEEMFCKPQLYNGFNLRSFYPYFVKNKLTAQFDNLYIVAQKPENGKFSPIFDSNKAEATGVKMKPNLVQKVLNRFLYS